MLLGGILYKMYAIRDARFQSSSLWIANFAHVAISERDCNRVLANFPTSERGLRSKLLLEFSDLISLVFLHSSVLKLVVLKQAPAFEFALCST